MEAWRVLEQHAWALLTSGQLRSLARLGQAASVIGGGLPALLRNLAPDTAASTEQGRVQSPSIAHGAALNQSSIELYLYLSMNRAIYPHIIRQSCVCGQTPYE